MFMGHNWSAKDFRKSDKSEADEIFIALNTDLIEIPTIWRVVFGSWLFVVFTFGIIGNIFTLFVNCKRNRKRLLLRTCLISLTISDLLLLISISSVYSTQLINEYPHSWVFGGVLCNLIPFVQTSSVLANSITITTIALDRYIAVNRFVSGIWEPKPALCNSITLLIWGFACGVSSPMIGMYLINTIHIIIMPESGKVDLIGDVDYFVLEACGHNGYENSTIMTALFCFIFAPLLFAFLFLNSIIAHEIWNRRHPIERRYKTQKSYTNNSEQNASEDSNGTTMKTSEEATKSSGSNQKVATDTATVHHQENVVINMRKKRQIKMFKVVVVIMTTFFICRLPQWIFTLVKMNISQANTLIWFLMNYSFGILSLTNCALNPILYTFLNETLKITEYLTNFCTTFRTNFRRFFVKKTSTQKMENGTENNNLRENNGGVYMG